MAENKKLESELRKGSGVVNDRPAPTIVIKPTEKIVNSPKDSQENSKP